MRFEIRSGGVAAIFLGIAVLSGVVFMLGALAGYDIGRESQSSEEQVTTAFPLETAPAAAPVQAPPAPAVAAAPSAGGPIGESNLPPPAASASASSANAAAAAKAATHRKPVAHAAAMPGARSVAPIAREEMPPSGELSIPSSPASTSNPAAESAGTTADTEAPPPAPVASAAPPPHRRPYNIQIQAAMDRNSAAVMVRRLQNLGYTPRLVPTPLAGQTWYKVMVGPYSTQQEAAAAQEQLRTRYNSTYGFTGTATPTKPED